MAVDTRNKRAACLGFAMPPRMVWPNPDNDLANQADRQHMLFCFPGILAGLVVSLSWTASASSDVDHYNIYRGKDANIELTAAAYDTAASSPWTDSLVDGHYEYLVRAVDGDGNEEANLSQMVAIDISGGARLQRPNEPSVLDYRAAAGGEVELTVAYVREGEDGTATEVRLYVNDGAGGAIDYNTSVGSASLASGLDFQAVTITSSGLSGGLTYRCGVRARTAGGVEDANTDHVEVTTDATAPSAPTLSGSII